MTYDIGYNIEVKKWRYRSSLATILVTYNIVYPISESKFCTYDIVGHLRPPTISKVLYDIVDKTFDIGELRYRSFDSTFERDIVVSYDIGTYDIVGNYDIGGGKPEVPDAAALPCQPRRAGNS